MKLGEKKPMTRILKKHVFSLTRYCYLIFTEENKTSDFFTFQAAKFVGLGAHYFFHLTWTAIS